MLKMAKNFNFCSSEGSSSYCIGHQPLYYHYTILSNIFKTQDGVSRLQSGSPTTKVAKLGQNKSKIAQKTSLSDLVWNPAAVASAINHSIFNE